MGADLTRALELAISTACEAGDLLRAEFHRAGGPRGEGAHAQVDGEVEQLILGRLRSAFPEHAFVGEETGADGSRHAAACWYVDPNEGAAAFLRGHRGSAVSIALVIDGLPVLGVVHAPLAPDSGGDLVARVEGGPLVRNGRAVERPRLPAQLGRYDLVLLGPDADLNPEASGACCAPARFRAVPSIAYRLALVAAGEGEAAVSLDAPTCWEVAAGHALLRAAGGELVDLDGAPIRYGRHDTCGGAAFGGSAAVSRELARRRWATVRSPRAALVTRVERDHPQVTPEPGMHVSDAARLARAQGCLLGQLAGDALGAQVELQGRAYIRKLHPEGLSDLHDGGTFDTLAGQPTDDSELALLLARELVARRALDLGALEDAYRAWLASGPFDVGTTIRAALAGSPARASQSNGALMRISPLAIFGRACTPETLAGWADAECGITHPHPVCRAASAVFVTAIRHAICHGDGPRAAFDAALAMADALAEKGVTEALRAAESLPPADYQHDLGWVLLALQNAFHQLLHARSVQEGLVATVMAGGDTDTNAAIAGALLGAVHGRDAIPLAWRRLVLSCRPIADTGQPRPRCFWPVDALELAERLLVVGPTG